MVAGDHIKQQVAIVIGRLVLLVCLLGTTSAIHAQRDDASIDAEANTHILFVFDASNSMNAFWEGKRKIEVATSLLSKSLASLYGIPGLKLGLRVYGHQTTFIQGEQDCDDTELVVPLAEGNNLLIQKALGRIQARGTTPIARSLERTAADFPAEDARKVIVLITDGIEACDEDPCAVSRMLQEEGIIVKPFIIGIGLEEEYKDTFRCVGNFFDAADPATFEEVLDIVIEQAMLDTSFEVDLIDGEGEATVTNVATSLFDSNSGELLERFVHTLGPFGETDTIPVDPVPTYRIVVHTIPPLERDGVRFTPRKHNHVRFENSGQGIIIPQFARGERNAYGDLPVAIHRSGEAEPLITLGLNERLKVLTGTYDVFFPTYPPMRLEGIEVKEDQDAPVIIPQPGYLQLDAAAAGYGSILSEEGLVVYKWDVGTQNPSGRYLLQPGNYTVVYRSRSARSMAFSQSKPINIRSGFTTHLSLNG